MQNREQNIILLNPNYSNNELKNLLFQGKILHFTNCKNSLKLIQFAIQFLQTKLKIENLQYFEHKVSKEEFYQRISVIKLAFSKSPQSKKIVKNILKEMHFNLKTNYFDLVRLRAITSYAHTIKEAKPAFAIHRDTWYANPESQINWWIPLFDVGEKDTFSFFPDYFSKPVKNNSNKFDYDIWNSSGGFQSTNSDNSRIFPDLQEEIDFKNVLKIPCKSGDLLLFSATHLHGTSPNTTNHTRFSLDFRTVDLHDLNKNGSVNVDNYSTGTILKDMLPVNNFFHV